MLRTLVNSDNIPNTRPNHLILTQRPETGNPKTGNSMDSQGKEFKHPLAELFHLLTRSQDLLFEGTGGFLLPLLCHANLPPEILHWHSGKD